MHGTGSHSRRRVRPCCWQHPAFSAAVPACANPRARRRKKHSRQEKARTQHRMHALRSPGTAAAPLCSTTHDSGGQSQRLCWNDLVNPQAARDGCSTNNYPASAAAGNRMHLVSGRHRKSQQGPSHRVKLWSGSLPLALPTVAAQDCNRSTFVSIAVFSTWALLHTFEQSKARRLHAPRPAQRSTAHVRVCTRGAGCNQRPCRNALNATHRGNMCAATDANCARHRHATMGGQ